MAWAGNFLQEDPALRVVERDRCSACSAHKNIHGQAGLSTGPWYPDDVNNLNLSCCSILYLYYLAWKPQIAADWVYCMAISTHTLRHPKPRSGLRQCPQSNMQMQWSLGQASMSSLAPVPYPCAKLMHNCPCRRGGASHCTEVGASRPQSACS